MSLMFAIIALYKADRLDAADRVLERELRVARERGALSTYALVCTFRGAVGGRRGGLAAAEADFPAGLDAVAPEHWQWRQLSAGLLNALTESGQLDDAQALLTAGGWDEDLPDDRSTNVLLATRSRLRHALGEHRRALADALEARRRGSSGSHAVDVN